MTSTCLLLLSILAFDAHCWGQKGVGQKGETYHDLLTPQVRSDTLGTPEHL